MFTHGSAKTPVREAVLHCAAIKTGQFKGMRAFQVFATVNQWHIKRGFKNGFGYHGIFMPDGDFAWGRPYSMVGVHVKGHNTGTLGFLMIESREIKPPNGVDERLWLSERSFDDFYTPAQREAVKYCLSKIPGLQKVSGHNDHAARLCPGFKVKSSDWL